MDKYREITALRSLVAEGCPPAKLGPIEAELVVMLSKARRERKAEMALVERGATVAAEQCGCHRATVYRRAIKSRKHAQTATL